MIRRRHLRLILNGKAAGNPALRDLVPAARRQGHTIEVRVTWESGDAARFAEQAAREQVEVVVACGGDGTVNEVVHGLLAGNAGPETALGILPFGTANDFAQGCRLPAGDPGQALQLILENPATPIDVGQVNDRYFINVASGGFGAEVTSRTPVEIKRLLGGAAYSLMGLASVGNLTPCTVRLTIAGQTRQVRMLVLAVGNGRQAGGGFQVAPKALLNDGLLDLMLVHDLDVTELGRVVSELLDVSAPDNRHVTYLQAAGFHLEARERLQLNLDGEPLVGNSFDFRVLASRLPCILPADAPLAAAAGHRVAPTAADLRLVPLETLENPALAELLRIELDQAGIRCQLEGLHQAGLAGVLPIRLFVPQAQLEDARRILARHERRR
ncbi:MAG: lipid kinase YegS [Pirellulaceae bacterium]|nr:lipid kinase YegS [Pirellulaceae bacterium]